MVSAGVCFGLKWILHFIPKTKVNAKLCVETLLNKIADLFYHLPSSFNRTARLHTRQSWLKIGLLPTAVNSLVKMNGLRTRLTSTLWTTMSGELCLNATSHFYPSRRTSMSSRKFCSWWPAATGLDQQSHIELPEKISGLYESWWWTLRTYAKMNYLSDFGIYNNSQCFITLENYKLLLIIPCRIETMAYNIYIAITWRKLKYFF